MQPNRPMYWRWLMTVPRSQQFALLSCETDWNRM
jgi:hypothetical protein